MAGTFTVVIDSHEVVGGEPQSGRLSVRFQGGASSAIVGGELRSLDEFARRGELAPSVSAGYELTLPTDVAVGGDPASSTVGFDLTWFTGPPRQPHGTLNALFTGQPDGSTVYLSDLVSQETIPTAASAGYAAQAEAARDEAVAAAATLDVEAVVEAGLPTYGVGDDLTFRRVDGNAGTRVSLSSDTPGVMPYWEVVATTVNGSDSGHAVGGFQAHMGPDSGAGEDRRFWYLEMKDDNHSLGRHFRMGTWGTTPGVGTDPAKFVPFMIDNGNGTAMKFDPDTKVVTFFQPIEFGPSVIEPVLRYHRDGSNGTPLRAMTSSNTTDGPQFVLGKSRGTKASPTAPASNDTLGQFIFASWDGTTRPGAMLRAVTTQAWTFGSASGTKMQAFVKANGSDSYTEALSIAYPATSAEASLRVAVNRGGTVTLDQVTVGAPDSGGTGFRSLRVPN